MNLVIDIGNTSAKLGVFENNKIIEKQNRQKVTAKTIEIIFEKYPAIKHSILCSVVAHDTEMQDYLNSKTTFILFETSTKIPINNNYQTPETLGKDRLANAIGANELCPNCNTLVIDIGTCIKYDFVDETNTYLGGSISLGITMRYKALQHFTAKLPLVSTNTTGVNLIGNNTISAIQSGVQLGAIAEIEGIIEKYKNTYNNLQTLVTGGGAPLLQNEMKINIFADPNLTLKGLNRILNFNK